MHLHIAQVPPPPQADGRKTFSLDNVDNRVVPAAVTSAPLSSPFMIILTLPDCTSLLWANKRIITRSKITIVKAVIAVTMVVISI
jgi:hypothetical protein